MALTTTFVCIHGDRYTRHTRDDDVWVQEYITRASLLRTRTVCVYVCENERERERGEMKCMKLDFKQAPKRKKPHQMLRTAWFRSLLKELSAR